jgi:hypothetical protein
MIKNDFGRFSLIPVGFMNLRCSLKKDRMSVICKYVLRRYLFYPLLLSHCLRQTTDNYYDGKITKMKVQLLQVISKTPHRFDIHPFSNCDFLYNLSNVNILKDTHFSQKMCVMYYYTKTLITIANCGKFVHYYRIYLLNFCNFNDKYI